MRLEMRSFAVKNVQFSNQTRFEEGVLFVDPEELRDLVLAGGAFENVSVEIVRPGDDVRLIHVMDAAEPRYKPAGGSTFPGLVGPQQIVGRGTTHRLAGMAVVSVGEPVAGETTYWREAIIEMSGPGAAMTPFSSTINLVLDFKPHPDYLDREQPEAEIKDNMKGSALAQRYNYQVRVAELKVSARLAKATADLQPEYVQVYELTPTGDSLPKVVYFLQGFGLFLYGETADTIIPTILHPNEVLDGALVNIRSNIQAFFRESTYLDLNHGIINQFYARHGKDLDFAGVIVYPDAYDSISSKERMTHFAVKLAQMLGAQGACSSYLGGGHPCIEFMRICQECEQAGIKTVLIMPESYGTPDEPGFVYTVPEAVAIVSTGRGTQKIDLPGVDRVIGGTALLGLADDPSNALSIPLRYLFGSCVNTGNGRLTVRQY